MLLMYHDSKINYRNIGNVLPNTNVIMDVTIIICKEKNKHSTIGHSRKCQNETCPCYKCGMLGHLGHQCYTPEYFVKMFQENKKLWAKTCEVHTIDASMDPFGGDDIEAYMTKEISIDESHDVFIDSTTTHIILRDKWFSFFCWKYVF